MAREEQEKKVRMEVRPGNGMRRSRVGKSKHWPSVCGRTSRGAKTDACLVT